MVRVSCYLVSILVILCLHCTCYVGLTKDLHEPDRFFNIFLITPTCSCHHSNIMLIPCCTLYYTCIFCILCYLSLVKNINRLTICISILRIVIFQLYPHHFDHLIRPLSEGEGAMIPYQWGERGRRRRMMIALSPLLLSLLLPLLPLL